MSKRPEHLSNEERLRELGLSLEQRRLRVHIYEYLKGGYKEDRDRLFPVVPSAGTRGLEPKMGHRRVPLKLGITSVLCM